MLLTIAMGAFKSFLIQPLFVSRGFHVFHICSRNSFLLPSLLISSSYFLFPFVYEFQLCETETRAVGLKVLDHFSATGILFSPYSCLLGFVFILGFSSKGTLFFLPDTKRTLRLTVPLELAYIESSSYTRAFLGP